MIAMKKGNSLETVKPMLVSKYVADGWAKVEAKETKYNLFKVVDGDVSSSASKRNLTAVEAEEWMMGREFDYTMVEVD